MRKPTKKKRVKAQGFRERAKTGAKILNRRRSKGRKNLAKEVSGK